MIPSLHKGRYTARTAQGAADLRAAQELRHLCFVERDGATGPGTGREADAYDPDCTHILVEDDRDGRLVCCFRLMALRGGAEIGRSYSAQYYDLSGLAGFAGPMVELGRFCIHPEAQDGDVLRVAWGALTRIVDAGGVELLFGCSSFPGTRAETYREAFAVLQAWHIAPDRWRPRVKAPDVVRFADAPEAADRKRGMLRMPPLLRTYLAMGGWVSDHAVVDAAMNTLHVFTGLEIRAIPPARARALRAVAS